MPATKTVKETVKETGKDVPGFGLGGVGTHANRSAVIMAIYPTNLLGFIVILIVRWLLNTYFLYIWK